jgi:hypothetical protein
MLFRGIDSSNYVHIHAGLILSRLGQYIDFLIFSAESYNKLDSNERSKGFILTKINMFGANVVLIVHAFNKTGERVNIFIIMKVSIQF